LKLRFQRAKSYIGFGMTTPIIINNEIIYRLKNGEVFEYDVNNLETIVLKGNIFIKDLKIPIEGFDKNVDILIQYTGNICRTNIQAIVSEQGKLIGVYQ